MTEGPFRSPAAFGSAADPEGAADLTPVDRAAVDDAEAREADAGTDVTSTGDPVSETDTFECGPVDLSEMTDLLADSDVDRIWVDLDGDLVADPEEAIDGPFAVEGDTSSPVDDVEFDSWITFPVDEGGVPLYDVASLAPASPYGIDWTTPGAHGYDPMTLSNYSVEGGPVLYDPAQGLSYYPSDYTDPSLWYNQGSYDTGAGYWDPAYSSTPAGVDPNGWTPMPGTDPMAFDQLSTGYDPTVPPGLPTYTPMEGTSFDPNNPLPTYTPLEGTSYDPNNPLPTYSPFDTGAGMPSVPGAPGYLPMSPGAGYDASAGSGSWMDAYSTPGDDPSAGNPTDVVTSYYTDPTFDNQLSEASAESGFWMDQYDQAAGLESQYWQASVDASVAGDDLLAYDLNQLSLQSGSVADDAWSYSSTAYDSVSTTSTSSADDGWYDAMSLDS